MERETTEREEENLSDASLVFQTHSSSKEHTHLASPRIDFSFLSSALHQIRVVELGIPLVMGLEERHTDAHGWLGAEGVPRLVTAIPPAQPEAAARCAVQGGERDPAGLGHGRTGTMSRAGYG